MSILSFKQCCVSGSVAEPVLEPEGAVIKLSLGTGAVVTNYGSGSTALDFAIDIVLCWMIWIKKMSKHELIHRRV
jgi:hypothetical protein